MAPRQNIELDLNISRILPYKETHALRRARISSAEILCNDCRTERGMPQSLDKTALEVETFGGLLEFAKIGEEHEKEKHSGRANLTLRLNIGEI